jgi:8-oxo-dGTP diphosphatase
MSDERTLTFVAGLLRDGDRILLGHRSPGRRSYPDVWDLPGGHIEAGESPPEALVRELREELAITIREPVLPPLAVVPVDDVMMAVWLVETWDGPVRNAAPDEHDALAWLDLAALEALAVTDLAHPQYPDLFAAALTGK